METTDEPSNNDIAVLNWIDIVVIVAYFVFVMLVGVWVSPYTVAWLNGCRFFCYYMFCHFVSVFIGARTLFI